MTKQPEEFDPIEPQTSLKKKTLERILEKLYEETEKIFEDKPEPSEKTQDTEQTETGDSKQEHEDTY